MANRYPKIQEPGWFLHAFFTVFSHKWLCYENVTLNLDFKVIHIYLFIEK